MEQEEIQKQIDALNLTKTTLETDINQKNATITQLDTDIASRGTTRDGLNTQIATLTASKNEVESQVAIITQTKATQEEEVNLLNYNKNNLNTDIRKLEEDKRKLEENVKKWRETSDLFSNDIAGISEDSSKQRTKYALGIGLSFITAIVLMIILICSVKGKVEIPVGIETDLAGEPTLLFLVFLLIRISIVGSLFVLIFVFINLTRGFVSQFIRTQEKMTAVRLLDYLVSKIGKESNNLSEAEKISFENKKMDEQKILLNKYLPELIENNPSSFDKLSKTKNPEEFLTELLKSGKIELPK